MLGLIPGAAMASDLTWRDAIDKILGESTTPLRSMEITERIIADGLRTSLGATPSATVHAIITASIKKDGAKSPYVRVARGLYALAKSATTYPVTTPNKLT